MVKMWGQTLMLYSFKESVFVKMEIKVNMMFVYEILWRWHNDYYRDPKD